ncbi:MAG: UDP-N-acetyl-D-mannosamine dehydrogenase, partial [Firmicutes bacterium]|nr:UDP-N-acetyl-D-mannosamine dehydrogenase [Bacillota bacterium]
ERLNINVWDVIRLCNKHPRVNIHQPGPGVGGHCIAVDPWFIVEKEPSLANMIHLARTTNDSMPTHVADRIAAILEGVEDPKVTILGVTYKPDVDDMRESPLLHLKEILLGRGVEVACYDPFVIGKPGITNDLMEAASGSDLLLLGVHHHQFKALDFEALGQIMRRKNFFDTRNFVDMEPAMNAGFSCTLLGKN